MASSPWPRPDEAPTAADLAQCVHCGLCINACPTFALTGLETESPRGRIYLARAVAEERIPLTSTVEAHWDNCLQCRACEAVCPSGVAYGRIIEGIRAQTAADPQEGRMVRAVRRFALRNVVARPRVLALAMAAPRLYAGSRLRRVAERAGTARILPGPLRTALAQLPSRPGTPFRPPRGPAAKTAKSLLFTGCVMGELFGNVHRATLRVLLRAGLEPATPPGQGCCGALHAHDGDIDFARRLARRNIEVFEAAGQAPIVVNSAGCGAAMKEYGHLLEHDAGWAERARRFSARVRDLSEVLDPAMFTGTFHGRVAYQDACHLAHAQRIREQPRALLRGLQGCSLVETPGADMCCGAAGIYSVVKPANSAQLRARKAQAFADARPDAVVTANPGCQMQYEAAVREAKLTTRVMHLAEVLDEATSGQT